MINDKTTYIDGSSGINRPKATIVEMLTLVDVLVVRLSNGHIYILNAEQDAEWEELPRVPGTW